MIPSPARTLNVLWPMRPTSATPSTARTCASSSGVIELLCRFRRASVLIDEHRRGLVLDRADERRDQTVAQRLLEQDEEDQQRDRADQQPEAHLGPRHLLPARSRTTV